jgi:polysaccharide pyruvyl transferase WcaK-like protein
MRIVVTNYTGDRGNWGCQATSRNLLAFLRRTFSTDAAAEISTIPLPAGHPVDSLFEVVHGDRIRAIYANTEPGTAELNFLDALARERFGSAYERARQADVVVFQGEGSVGPSFYFSTPILFALPFLAAHLWKKPVLSLNQTLYASTDEEKAILRSIFNSFDLIAVREMASYRFAREIGISRTVLCPDMALGDFDHALPGIAQTPRQGYFCVSGSAAIRSVAERHGLKPVFMVSRRKDESILAMAGSELGGIPFDVVSSENSPEVESVLPVLRSAKFVIGGRYHTAVSALSQSTPVILLPGNTFKSEGIGPMLGLDIPVLDIQEREAILARVDDIVGHENEMRSAVSRTVAEARQSYDALAGYMKGIVDQRVLAPGNASPEPDPRLTPALAKGAGQIKHDVIYRQRNYHVRPMRLKWMKALKLKNIRRKPGYAQSIEATLTDLP